jgi:hypothetical protein
MKSFFMADKKRLTIILGGLSFLGALILVMVLRSEGFFGQSHQLEQKMIQTLLTLEQEILQTPLLENTAGQDLSRIQLDLQFSDFVLAPTKKIPLTNGEWQVTAASTTKTDNFSGVFLKLKHQSSESLFSLFQFPWPSGGIFGANLAAEFQLQKDGKLVRVWKENNLLYGLVGPF